MLNSAWNGGSGEWFAIRCCHGGTVAVVDSEWDADWWWRVKSSVIDCHHHRRRPFSVGIVARRERYCPCLVGGNLIRQPSDRQRRSGTPWWLLWAPKSSQHRRVDGSPHGRATEVSSGDCCTVDRSQQHSCCAALFIGRRREFWAAASGSVA